MSWVAPRFAEDGAALRYVDEALRGDREFVLNALQRNAEVQMRALIRKRMFLLHSSRGAGVAIRC